MSTLTIVRGNPLLQLRKQVEKFDPSRGYYDRYEYESATQQPAINFANDCQAAGMITELTLADDKATLVVEDPTREYNVDVWQMLGNRLDIDGLSHPLMLNLLEDEQIAVIRAGVDNAAESSDNTGVNGIISQILSNKIFTAENPPFSQSQLYLIRTFIGLQFKGSANFLRAQYVLKHTTNVSNRYPYNISNLYTLTVYSADQLYAEALGGVNGASWTNPCPVPLLNDIIDNSAALSNSIFGLHGGSDPNYMIGWLKMPGEKTTTAYNRIDIETEYILDLWSLYGSPSAGGYYPASGAPGSAGSP